MQQFQNILCVVDAAANEQIAFNRAVDLAVQNEAGLRIVDVIDDTPSLLNMFLRSHRELIELPREHGLADLCKQAQQRGLVAHSRLLRGRPALSIVSHVQEHGCDLVIKDARATDSHKKLLVGPVDMRLLRNCPCAVWLNMPDQGSGHEVVLAAIDPLASDPAHKSMNQRILKLAASFQANRGAQAHVVAAWNAQGENMLSGRVSADQLMKYVLDNHRAAEHGLDQAVSRIHPRIESKRVQLRKGTAADEILDHAIEIRCDLLIMGPVARGIKGLLIGNTADAVLRQIKCSVLTVKPEGFLSPIGLSG